MEHKLRDDCFLVGNNCGVGWMYKDVLKKPYDTPFAWNYINHGDMVRFARLWDDIDWHAQDWKPHELGSFEKMRENYEGFFATRDFPLDKWWDMYFHARNGETVKVLFPFLDFREDGDGFPKLERRVERFMVLLEKKKPVFIFMRNFDDRHWTDEQKAAIKTDDRCVLCDYEGERHYGKYTTKNILLPMLVERGFVIETER